MSYVFSLSYLCLMFLRCLISVLFFCAVLSLSYKYKTVIRLVSHVSVSRLRRMIKGGFQMAVAKPVKKTFKRSLNGIIIAMDNKSCCILLQEDKNNNKKKKTINNQPHTQQDQQQKRRCCDHTLSTATRGQKQQRYKKILGSSLRYDKLLSSTSK